MKHCFLILLISASELIILCACSEIRKDETINNQKERELIEETINNNIAWVKNKDFKLLYSSMSNDSDYLEVDPEGPVIRGINEFKKSESFWTSPDFKPIRYEIRDLTINISKSGDAAWWYCILDDINEWKGQPACWINTRWTGVLEKRKGRWIIVQMHFSFAAK